ncbi:HAMP domain-containing sensor histidine kinase [Brevundimonas sp.]|uniref:sensor histidine kinase n=1 Tax=Brevundimonas sp. TaxID=1871086 RepID=UPI001AC69C2D|nr:HAMP domain-containing sensor histidine kinase [Brevundimonas sp.]MBN9466990.1 HAMP domain-containing histidine kinase [Brevundimonas sp.]
MIRLRPATSPARASAVARLTLAYGALFIIISSLFFAGAMHLVVAKNSERLQSLVAADSRVLAAKLDEAPADLRVDIGRAIVGARVAQAKDRVQYALVVPRETPIGNLDMSAVHVSTGGGLRLETPGWLSASAIDRLDLGPNAYILLGRTQDEAGLERDVLAVGLLALALAALIAFVIGPVVSARLVRRVEAVNLACEAFGAGDLTARAPGAEVKDEFGALARSVNAMFERIDALVGGLRDVSNRAAHDLRTPIARLRTNLESVRSASSLPLARAAAEAAITETQTILATFDALLDVAEIEAGATLNLSPVDLAEVAQQAATLYAPVAEEVGIELKLDLQTARVVGEDVLLVRVVANLLDNALKYCPKGASIRIETRQNADATLLTISDDGPGIAASLRRQILQSRVRGPGAQGPGLGLGLALVAAVARRHDAELKLTASPSGHGLQITLIFPGIAQAV